MEIINKILLIVALFIISCRSTDVGGRKHINDFKTEGFLDPHHFQIIVIGYPRKHSKGLVGKRESALSDAKSKIGNRSIKALIDYYRNFQLKKKGNKGKISKYKELSKLLFEKFMHFKKHGYIAFEYYNEDNSAVIVYRIFKEDMRSEIENVKVDFKLDNKLNPSKK